MAGCASGLGAFSAAAAAYGYYRKAWLMMAGHLLNEGVQLYDLG